jgi:hypothetical protein
LIYALAYGKRLERGDEHEVEEIAQIMEGLLSAVRVGIWVVDALPVLNCLPAFLAPWKRYVDELHNFEVEVYARNMRDGQKRAGWNWSKNLMSIKESQDMPPLELAYDVGITYEAGSDTTTMAMEAFVMATVLYGATVVPKARKESTM